MIGAVGGPFGVHGWVHVKSFTAPPGNLLAYRPWRIRCGSDWREVDAEARSHRRSFVARIDGCADRDAAAGLTGTEIGIAPDLLPPTETDQYYWRDLVGCRVVGTDGDLGLVTRVFATPAHDVLVVGREGGREGGGIDMIPFVREIVTAVDLEAGRIAANWQSTWSDEA